MSDLEQEEIDGMLAILKLLGREETMRARKEARCAQQKRMVLGHGKILGGKLTVILEFDPKEM